MATPHLNFIVVEDNDALDSMIVNLTDEIQTSDLAGSYTVLNASVVQATNAGVGIAGLDVVNFVRGFMGNEADLPTRTKQEAFKAGLLRLVHAFASTDPSFDLTPFYPTGNRDQFLPTGGDAA